MFGCMAKFALHAAMMLPNVFCFVKRQCKSVVTTLSHFQYASFITTDYLVDEGFNCAGCDGKNENPSCQVKA